MSQNLLTFNCFLFLVNSLKWQKHSRQLNQSQVWSLHSKVKKIFVNILYETLGPFNGCVKSDLKLTNSFERPVYFKVKTTVPNFYCVRPNSGIIKPFSTSVIQVMLQPVEQASNSNNRTRHKFMIQVLIIFYIKLMIIFVIIYVYYNILQAAFCNEEDVSVESFWKQIDPTKVIDSKLKVVFLDSNGDVIDSPIDKADIEEPPDINLTLADNNIVSFSDTIVTQPKVNESQVGFTFIFYF